MQYGNISNNSIHKINTGSYKYQTMQYHLKDKAAIKESLTKNNKDSLTISEEAKKALDEKIHNDRTQVFGIDGQNIKKLVGISQLSCLNDFEKTMSALNGKNIDTEWKEHFPEEEGTPTDTFSKYTNKMVLAYSMMSENIEEKYADPNRETEYFIDSDGSVQELTKEKEKEMLEKAYRGHSEFMATSIEIWNNISGTELYTRYGSGKTVTYSLPPIHGKNKGEKIVESEKGEIKNSAYQAFMSAITESNISQLKGTKGSWNHVKLDLSVSKSQANDLNKIWDYYKAVKS